MLTATLRWSRRHLILATALLILSGTLTFAIGVPQAAAAAEVVQFQAAISTTPEGTPPVINVLLTRDPTPPYPAVDVTVSATPSGIDPAEAGDYDLASATVTFPSGDPSGTARPVSITFPEDAVFENDEELTLTIESVSVGTIGTPSTHTATIANDDPAPTLDILDASNGEGAGPATFTVRRTGLTELAATAVATPSSGTATATADFDATPGAVSVLPGGATGTDTFSVPLVADAIYEKDESFTVTLAGYSGPGDFSAIGTIVDDDDPPTLSIDDVTVNESDGSATFTVTRSGLTAFAAEVDVATADDTAAAGEDYTADSDTLTIGPGGATATAAFVVPITADDFDEDAEAFRVNLSDPDEATIADSSGTGTINDDDTAGVDVDEDDGVIVLEGDSPDTFTVVLTSEPRADVTVAITNADSQTIASPTELTFTAANWDTPQDVTVTAVEDGIDEEDPHSSVITLTTASSDDDYDGVPLGAVIASVADADALVVSIDGPSFGAVDATSVFSAMVNAGGTGTITYDWSVFFDGVPVQGVDGDEATFQFTPSEGGEYIVSAIVGDDQGQNPAVFIFFTALGDIGTSVFIQDIIWLAEEGITRGCNPPDNDQFCPDKTVTRGQMAAFLVRFLDLNAIDPTIEFTDTAGSIFEQDILKLATAGITRGCNADGSEFCPDKGVTRGQMAAFLVRAFGLTDNGGGDLFDDDDDSIFEDDIDKLATAGITRGCNPPDNTNFCPDKTVTRGQMAAFLHRAEDLLP
ncbi:MAG: Calx-beta domain-containing protein [Acidimicrobiia bacterium]|nr:Calx-beta domain-containing protein [Acidimicrobiia bacterium]